MLTSRATGQAAAARSCVQAAALPAPMSGPRSRGGRAWGPAPSCPRCPDQSGLSSIRSGSSAPARAGPAAGGASTSGEKWWMKSTPNMRDIHSVQELVDALADAGDNLVIVDFYGEWCGACRALYPKLVKLMEQFPDVQLLKINFDENKQMCKTLGVKVLPFFHVYHGAEGRVAAFSCTVTKFQRMRDALEQYHTPICSLEDNPGLPEFPEIIPHPSEVTRVAGVALASAEERLAQTAAAPAVV